MYIGIAFTKYCFLHLFVLIILVYVLSKMTRQLSYST